MPGHSFEDRQRKAGYDSFSRAAQDTTPAPISNREFNEQLEQAQNGVLDFIENMYKDSPEATNINIVTFVSFS